MIRTVTTNLELQQRKEEEGVNASAPRPPRQLKGCVFSKPGNIQAWTCTEKNILVKLNSTLA